MSSYTPDPSKCASITQGNIDEQELEWAEKHSETIRNVQAVIETSILRYEQEYRRSSLALTPTLIDSKFAEAENWTVGGSDGYGVFGVDGDLFKKIDAAKAVMLTAATPSNTSTNSAQKKEAEEILEILNDFYGGFEQTIKDIWKELADIQFCHQKKLADEELNQGPILLAIDKFLGGLEDVQALKNLQSGSTLLPDVFDVSDFPESKLIFSEQCYLLTNIFNLAKIKEEIDHGLNPSIYTGIPQKELADVVAKENRTVLAVGEPFGFINTLTQSPSKSLFFEMTNEQLSTLIPMIRLFKVIENTEENPEECIEEKEIEIIFDTHDLQDDITRMFSSDSGTRGIGVGLKNFSFAYEADNPFAIKKSISAKLTIFANSFSELLMERKRKQNNYEPFSYIDLALKTGGSETVKLSRTQSNTAINNLNKLNFRLKAVVGWQIPIASRGLFSQDLLDAIYDSAISLNLTPTVHSFNLDENGRVTFTINYLAYGEDYFDNSNYNIFSKPDVVEQQMLRFLRVKKMGADCNIDAYNKFKNDEETVQTIEKEKTDSLRYLMEQLIATGKVYTIPIDQLDIDIYRAGGPYTSAATLYDKSDLETKITPVPASGTLSAAGIEPEDIDLENEDEDDEGTIVESTTPYTMSFFYASDLIDVILKGIGDSLNTIKGLASTDPSIDSADLAALNKDNSRLYENFHKLRILLGPLEISKPDSYSTSVLNLGDIPISIKNFLEFLTTKMLAKEKAEYFLTAFLNDFFNEFIINLLNRDLCYKGRARQKLFVHQNALTEYRQRATDDDSITKYIKSATCNPSPIPRGLSPIRPYMRRLYMDNTVSPPKPLTTCSPLPKPLLNVMGLRNDPRTNPGVCKEMNYLTFFAARSIPMNQVIGCKNPTSGPDGIGCYNENKEKVSDVGDHQRAIWHYQIGKDRGIVKNISLTETNSTGLAEVRFEQEGYDGLRQLRVLYDVTVDSFLDVSAFPGSYIYVEPRGFDIAAQTPSGFDLTQLGIGGYHMIWKSEHSISPGMAETKIHAKWVAARDASTIVDLEKKDPNTIGTPTKCATIGN